MPSLTRRRFVPLAASLAAPLIPTLTMMRPAAAEGVLQVGSYPSNPPFEFKDDTGHFQGFEIDLVNAIAAKLGRTVEITDFGFQALFAATASHRVDLAISSITVTPERLKNQDFTQPYLDTNLALIANASSRLKTLADVKGATLGAIASSTGEAWIKAHAAEYGVADTKSYDTAANMFLDTSNGRVDGSVNDLAGSLYAFRTMRGMHVVDDHLSGVNSIAIMLPKGAALTAEVNGVLDGLKHDGTVATLYAQWFGAEPAAGSSTVEVRPLPTRG